MNKESITEFQEHLGDYLNSLNIETIDKLELLINLMHYLENYEDNNKVLEEHRKKLLLQREDDD